MPEVTAPLARTPGPTPPLDERTTHMIGTYEPSTLRTADRFVFTVACLGVTALTWSLSWAVGIAWLTDFSMPMLRRWPTVGLWIDRCFSLALLGALWHAGLVFGAAGVCAWVRVPAWCAPRWAPVPYGPAPIRKP